MTATDHTPANHPPTDEDLANGIHALRGPLSRRGAVEPAAFTAGVHARARRRRISVVAGLVAVLVAAGVVIPLRLLGGGSASTVVPATSPSSAPPPARAGLHTHGGVTVTWLPTGMTHRADADARVYAGPRGVAPNNLAFAIELDDLPLLTAAADLFGPFSYISEFALPGATNLDAVAGSASTAPAAALAPPALVWVTATWDRYSPRDTAGIAAQLTNPSLGPVGKVDVTATTVAGQPAVLASADTDTGGRPGPADHRYRTALLWTAPDHTELAVEAAGPSPVDPAVVARIAARLTLGQRPAPPAPPDDTTAAAVRAAFHDAFAPGVPDSRWAAAVQDAPALAALHDEIAARHPGLAATLSVRVDQMLTVAPDAVSAWLLVSFTDPTVPSRLGQGTSMPTVPGGAPSSPNDTFGEAVHTANGWQISRTSYCHLIGSLGAPDLRCPS